MTSQLGELYANTASGIFGTMSRPPEQQTALPVGEAQPGPASIRSNVQGDEVREYAIEILSTTPGASDGRDMVVSVTDPALIEATGGIVQGMSGSPILQDGHLVGAVTHVLLSDPTKGYGIFIGNMLKASEN